jgi:hypothetical protein
MPLSLDILTKYKSNDIFIETGSNVGDGIQLAIDAGYAEIVSIEISELHYNIVVDRFKNNKEVRLIKGDSMTEFPNVINSYNTPVTIWLDGHYSCGNTGLGTKWSPLIEELESITYPNHIILIDDMRCWVNNNKEIQFGEEDIINRLMKINPNYKLIKEDGFVKEDILVAMP